MKNLLFTLLCAFSLIHPEGFVAKTNIHAIDTILTYIETLETGDTLWSPAPDGKYTKSIITNIQQVLVNKIVHLFVDDEIISMAADQRLYVAGTGWVKAKNIQRGDRIDSIYGLTIPVRKVIISHESATTVYKIFVTYPHTLCVGEHGLIAHNAAFIMLPAITYVIGEGFMWAGLGAWATALIYNVAKGFKEYLHERKFRRDWEAKENPSGYRQDKEKDPGCKICINGQKHPDQMHEVDPIRHPNGIYERAVYHNKKRKIGRKNKAPYDGQRALDNSYQVDINSPRRIGISQQEIVILDRQSNGFYHGHVRTFDEKELDNDMTRTLRKNNLIGNNGKILQ